MAAFDNLLQKLEKICRCSLCSNRLNDPKILPCLHRFCRDCLEVRLRQNNEDGLFTCPECRTSMEVHRKAYALSTDRHTENLVRCAEVISVLKERQEPVICGECDEVRTCNSYCFKCSQYMCAECHSFHVTRSSLRSHRDSILCLEETNVHGIAIEDIERIQTHTGLCGHHKNKFQRLVCVSCDEMFICELCATRYHKGHQTEDIISVAKQSFEQLQNKASQLSATKCRMDELVSRIESMQTGEGRKELSRILDMSYQGNVSLIKVGKCLIESEAERKCLEIRNRYKEKKSQIERMKDGFIHEVRDEYQTMSKGIEQSQERELTETMDQHLSESEVEQKCLEIRNRYQANLSEVENLSGDRIQEVKDQFQSTWNDLSRSQGQDIANVMERKQQQIHKTEQQEEFSINNFERLAELVDALEHDEARCCKRLFVENKKLFAMFDKYMSISERMLGSRDDIEIIECSGTVCSGMRDLLFNKNMQIESLEALLTRQTTLYTVPTVQLLDYESEESHEQPSSEHDIQIPEPFGDNSDGIIVTSNGSIVISAHGPGKSHFSIIDVTGELLRIQPFPSTILTPTRLCTAMRQNEIAMVCPPNELSIWDLHQDKKVVSCRLSDVLDMSKHGSVRCIASDPSTDTVYVGFFDCRTIHMFNKQLRYCRFLTLGQCPKWPYDMCISGNKILVCDLSGRAAFAADKAGTLLYRFEKPKSESEEWRPLSVCTDQRGLAYVLWQNAECTKGVVTQYYGDDGNMIAIRRVTKDACRIAVLETTPERRLLLISQKMKKLQAFDLTTQISI